MNKPPKSRVIMVLFFVAGFFAGGLAFAMYRFAQIPGDTLKGTMTKIGTFEVVRYPGIAAITTIVLGYVVQMTADIRWKLFEGQANA